MIRRLLAVALLVAMAAWAAWTVKPPVGTAVASTSLTSGLVHWWSMLEGSGATTADSVVSGGVTLTGGSSVAWSTNTSGPVTVYDGTANSIWTQAPLIPVWDTGAFSVTARVKTGADVNVRRTIVSSGVGFGLEIGNVSGKFGVIIPSFFLCYSTNAVLSTDTWYTLTFTRTGSGDAGLLYLDGTAIAITTNAQPYNATSTTHYWIGTRSTTQYWNGSIEFVAVHNRVLTPTEVAAIASNPYQMFAGGATGVRRRLIQ